jgi:hypothetical protein
LVEEVIFGRAFIISSRVLLRASGTACAITAQTNTVTISVFPFFLVSRPLLAEEIDSRKIDEFITAHVQNGFQLEQTEALASSYVIV